MFAVAQGTLWAGLRGRVAVGVAERQADVVAVATIEDVAVEAKVAVRVRLRISYTIKGQPMPLLLTAELAPSPMMAASSMRPQDMIPKTRAKAIGLWFLRENDGVFQVLPLGWGDFIFEDVYLPLPSTELPEPAAVIPGLGASGRRSHQLVLAALINSYLSSPDSSSDLRNLVVSSLQDKEGRQDSIAAAKALIASDSADHQILGLEAALRLGSDEALPLLAEKAPALQSHRMFSGVLFALGTEYKPNGEASIASLRQLAALHLSGVNFDATVAAALRKIGTKAVVPAMVELLDSQDPTAQLHAAHFLSEYALFADANGNIPVSTGPGRVAGPWGTDATQAHMPSRDSPMTAQEYTAFWKWWWAENKTKLGFPGP
jgi:hypothetical protein